MNIPISSEDIYRIFNGKIKIISYDQIRYYNNIDELLNPFDRVIILYFWKSEPVKYGHWCCLFRRPNNNIEFFDSYGTLENQLNNIDPYFARLNGEDYPYLTRLLYECPFQIEYNNKTLQSKKSSVCGRYCILRLLLSDYTIDEFNKLFSKSTIKNDKIVYNLTKDL